MSKRRKAAELRKAAAYPPMYLDDRLPDGYIVVCMGGGTEHSFCRRRLGLSVECPICGQIALSVELVADFYTARRVTAGLLRGRPALVGR